MTDYVMAASEADAPQLWWWWLALAPTVVLAGFLCYQIWKQSQFRNLERRVQYSFTVEPTDKISAVMAEGLYTMYPGENRLTWEAPVSVTRRLREQREPEPTVAVNDAT